MPTTVDVTDLPSMVGVQLEPSDWLKITQERVNAFADATNDHQFIHVKPLKARFTPFRGTVAHGFLSLSLLTYLLTERTPIPDGLKMTINYGSDKVRYIAPVKIGKRIRAHQKIVDVTEKNPGHWLVKLQVEVEIEGEDKPALVAEMLLMHVV